MRNIWIPSYLCLLSVITIFLILFISKGLSIKCWVCHSDADPKCSDPFDNSSLPIKDCKEVKYSHLTKVDSYEKSVHEYESMFPALYPNQKPPTTKLMEATMCRKIRQKIHGNWRTIRSCAFLGSPGEGTGNEHNCLYRQGTHDIYLEYCTCNSKDGCNAANVVDPKLFILFSLIVISLLISIKSTNY